MIHYTMLKLKDGADVTGLYFRCRKIYAELEMELPFLHDAQVHRGAATRDSDADIMMEVHIDAPECLNDYLRHPKYQELLDTLNGYVQNKMSFDEKESA